MKKLPTHEKEQLSCLVSATWKLPFCPFPLAPTGFVIHLFLIMGSLSMPSVSEQAGDNNINKKFLLPRKPARLPNPIIYRRLRRGSAPARIQGKQTEYPTDKDLLRTIAYLRSATAVFYEPDKSLPYNKAQIHDDEDDDEEGITEDDEEHNFLPHDEKGKQELEMSIQKYSKNSSHTMIKSKEKKRRVIVKENKKCDAPSSTSHVVVNFKDINETDQNKGLTKTLQKYGFTCKPFMHFCSAEIICPPEHRDALAVKLYGIQAALLSALGSPFDNISQSTSSTSSNSHVQLSIGQASIKFLPAMIWTGMLIVNFVYTVMVVWSLSFRIPIISMLCLSLLYSLSVLVAAASGFDVIHGTFRIKAILFASLGVFGLVMILVGLVVLVLFASWRCKK